MEYINLDGEYPRLSDTAVTLGKFDGLHRGHQKLLDAILQKREEGLTPVVFAFVTDGKMILTREERRALLEEAGVGVLIECPLSEEIRRMRPETFAREVLSGHLRARSVAVGDDFRFGFERKGTPETMEALGRRLGFSTAVIPREMEGKRKVSSTYIREELKNGNMEKTGALMGRPYFLMGPVVHGAGLGHRRLLPTINQIPPEDKLLPPDGVYVTRADFGGRAWYGMTDIGYKPTVDGSFLGAETFLFDCDEDLYDKDCRLEFLHFLRPEKRFAGIDALREQLMKDSEAAEEWLRTNNRK